MPTALELLGVPRAGGGAGREPPAPGARRALSTCSRTRRAGTRATTTAGASCSRCRTAASSTSARRGPSCTTSTPTRGEARDLSQRTTAARLDGARAGARRDRRARTASAAAAKGPQAIDAETEERLAALGYVGGSVSARHLEDRPRGDPKDKIGALQPAEAGRRAPPPRAASTRRSHKVAAGARRRSGDRRGLHAARQLPEEGRSGRRRRSPPTAGRSRGTPSTRARSSAWPSPTRTRAGSTKRGSASSARAQLDPRNGKVLWQLADVLHAAGPAATGGGGHPGRARAQGGRAPLPAQAGREPHRGEALRRGGEGAARRRSQKKPDLDTAHFNLGLVYEEKGETEKAIAAYEAELAGQRRRRTAPRSTWPSCSRRRAGSAEALARFRKAVELQPDFGTGPALPGQGAARRGRPRRRRAVGAQGARRETRSPDRTARPLRAGRRVQPPGPYRRREPRGRARREAAARELVHARAEAESANRRAQLPRRNPGASLAIALVGGLPPSRTARTTGAPPRARHDRHAARGPRGRLREPRRRDAAPRRPGARRRDGAAGLRPRAAHAALPRVALHRPPADRDRHPRQRLAGGRGLGPAAGRGPRRRRASRPAAFVSSVVLESSSGLDRGFDVYSDEFEASARRRAVPEHRAEDGATTRPRRRSRGSSRIEPRRARRPRCSCGCTSTTRTIPTSRRSRTRRRYRERPYDGEVAFADELVGRRRRRRSAAWASQSDTALVVTSDHGEGLGEHGETLHGFFAYQTTLRHAAVSFAVPASVPGRGFPAPCGSSTSSRRVLELLGRPAPAAGASRRAQPGRRAARRARRATSPSSTPRRWSRCCTSAGATCACCARAGGNTSRRRGRSCTTCQPTPARADEPRGRAAGARAGDAGGARPHPRRGAGSRAAARAARPPSRPSCSRSSARWATSAAAAPARDVDAGRRSQGQGRGVPRSPTT